MFTFWLASVDTVTWLATMGPTPWETPFPNRCGWPLPPPTPRDYYCLYKCQPAQNQLQNLPPPSHSKSIQPWRWTLLLYNGDKLPPKLSSTGVVWDDHNKSPRGNHHPAHISPSTDGADSVPRYSVSHSSTTPWYSIRNHRFQPPSWTPRRTQTLYNPPPRHRLPHISHSKPEQSSNKTNTRRPLYSEVVAKQNQPTNHLQDDADHPSKWSPSLESPDPVTFSPELTGKTSSTVVAYLARL